MPDGLTASSMTVTFGTAGPTSAKVISIKPPGTSLTMIDSTHFTSTRKTKIAGKLPELSDMTVGIQWNSDEDYDSFLDGVSQTITVTYQDSAPGSGGGGTRVFAGIISNIEPDEVSDTDTILTGVITITPTGASESQADET